MTSAPDNTVPTRTSSWLFTPATCRQRHPKRRWSGAYPHKGHCAESFNRNGTTVLSAWRKCQLAVDRTAADSVRRELRACRSVRFE
jgi:hypothetical protein